MILKWLLIISRKFAFCACIKVTVDCAYGFINDVIKTKQNLDGSNDSRIEKSIKCNKSPEIFRICYKKKKLFHYHFESDKTESDGSSSGYILTFNSPH